MNSESNVDVAAELQARTQNGTDERPQSASIAISYKPCELFEGGLGI